MKTGNKILIVFISIIAFLMLVGALDWRYFHHISDNKNSKANPGLYVGDFHNVVVKGIPYAAINSASFSQIVIYNEQKTNIPTINYKIIGDTLFVEPGENPKSIMRVKIYSKNAVALIKATDSEIYLCINTLDTLNVVLNRAKLYSIDNDTISMNINNLYISALNNSDAYLSNSTISNLNIFADDSNLTFTRKVLKLTGELKNGAELRCNDADEINLKREKGCRAHFNN